MANTTFAHTLADQMSVNCFEVLNDNGRTISQSDKLEAYLENVTHKMAFKTFIGSQWLKVTVRYGGYRQPFSVHFECSHTGYKKRHHKHLKIRSSYHVSHIVDSVEKIKRHYADFVKESEQVQAQKQTLLERYEARAQELADELGMPVKHQGVLSERSLGYRSEYKGFSMVVNEKGFIELDLTSGTKLIQIPFGEAQSTLDTLAKYAV